MTKLRFAPLLALAALTGCMKIRNELLVMPDGSGRVSFTFSIATKGDAAKFTEAQLMAGDPDEISDKVRGLVAMSRPTMEKSEGLVRIRMTGWFDDINALKLMDDGEGDKAKPKQEFAFRKDGEAFTLEIKGNLMADDAPDRRVDDPELQRQKEEMFKAMFAGFGFRHDVKLPGNITVADGFHSREGRVATWEVAEKDLQKPADQKKINAAVHFKVSCAKSEVTDAEAAEFRRDLEKAKAGWPELRKEMKRNAAGK